MRGSPAVPQQRLISRRYGWKRTTTIPMLAGMSMVTSDQVRWQAPQKSTESVGDMDAGLVMVAADMSSWPAVMAVTCFAPGPWQASQVTPGIAFSGWKLSETTASVV